MITSISIFVVIISCITFLIGFIMLFYESKRKLALKLVLFSIIAFVIGFGTCLSTFNL